MSKLKKIVGDFIANLVVYLNPIPEVVSQPKFDYEGTLADLEAKGFVVRIRHVRYFDGLEDNGVFATRVGYEEYRKDNFLNSEWTSYQYQVSEKGGYTEVTATHPDGREYLGRATCSLEDNFSRKTGRELALKRLVQNHGAELETCVLAEQLQ